MGFLDKILSKEKEAEKEQLPVASNEPKVCIPEARRQQLEKEALEQKQENEKQKAEETKEKESTFPEFRDEKPRLSAEGIFAVIDTLMVKGTVVSGKIQKAQLYKVGKKKFKVKDLQFEGRSTPRLLKGQSGAVFFDKAKGLALKAGTVLEFRQK